MEFNHKAVLFEKCLESLKVDPHGIYVDGTLGGGGHAYGICQQLDQEGWFVGIDRDQAAILAGGERLREFKCRKSFVQSNYAEIKEVLDTLGIVEINGALLDLGVSSFQLDNAERGFSYMQEASLDMRMCQDDSLTAYSVINEYSKRELARIIKEYGEERWASRVAQFIVEARKENPIETTQELVSIIKKAIPAAARRDGPHPAKRTFQAIRIEVNDELGLLEQAVEDFVDILAPGGRMAVITFHSLEDRIVKEVFQRRLNPCICPKEFPVCTCGKIADIKKISKKPIIADELELEENPRARSAKLRVIEKTGGAK
ncbi:MAG: 16S rRNA (cytosine(1402)-N(4))-methyltransferase RsmH [Anaerovoracaceae bacterium]|jgi:16S rRNA (cytosine1402-N4)-methyltransferase|nr:16S rRNA (cytosine(1402)-N(4))-methyltransferase RsmH [Anaerovoracaceae bacterium]